MSRNQYRKSKATLSCGNIRQLKSGLFVFDGHSGEGKTTTTNTLSKKFNGIHKDGDDYLFSTYQEESWLLEYIFGEPMGNLSIEEYLNKYHFLILEPNHVEKLMTVVAPFIQAKLEPEFMKLDEQGKPIFFAHATMSNTLKRIWNAATLRGFVKATETKECNPNLFLRFLPNGLPSGYEPYDMHATFRDAIKDHVDTAENVNMTIRTFDNKNHRSDMARAHNKIRFSLDNIQQDHQ